MANEQDERDEQIRLLKKLIEQQGAELKKTRTSLKKATDELDQLHAWMEESRDVQAITLAWLRSSGTIQAQLDRIEGACPTIDDVTVFNAQALNALDDIIAHLERITSAYKTARRTHHGVVRADDPIRYLPEQRTVDAE